MADKVFFFFFEQTFVLLDELFHVFLAAGCECCIVVELRGDPEQILPAWLTFGVPEVHSFDEVFEYVHSHAVVYKLTKSCSAATCEADSLGIESVLDSKPVSCVSKRTSAVEYK